MERDDGTGRDPVEAFDPPGAGAEDAGRDLLTIGLVVYFVALIGIVAAMMLLPAIL